MFGWFSGNMHQPKYTSIRKAYPMLRRKYALIALVAGLLALPTYSQSQAPQATPAPAGTQTQPPSTQSDVQLLVECVVVEKHECGSDSTETLGHHIKLR